MKLLCPFQFHFCIFNHIAAICRQCFVSLHDFRRITPHLPESSAATVANDLVSSKLDYFNSPFHSLNSKDMQIKKKNLS